MLVGKSERIFICKIRWDQERSDFRVYAIEHVVEQESYFLRSALELGKLK